MRYEYGVQRPNFSIEDIRVITVIRGKDFTNHYRDGRTNHGFIYVVRGAIRCDFAESTPKSIRLNAGQLLFVPKGTVYTTTYLAEDTEIKLIQFMVSSGALPGYMEKPLKPELPNAGALINAFWKPLHSYAFGHPFYTLSCFYELMWQLELGQTNIPTKYKKLHPALTELSANYTENYPIAHYAALCGISEPTFRRLFQEYTGHAPVDYRNDLRLQNARIKLQSGEYNVSEAAESSGFSNLSFFIRLYKKKYGHTPKKE